MAHVLVLPTLAVNWGNVHEGIALMIVGMMVVFTALIVVGMVVAAISAVLRRLAPAQPATPVADEAPAPSESEPALTPTLAIIAAAAAAVLAGRPVRVRRITPIGHASAWSQVGRASIQSSHNPRR